MVIPTTPPVLKAILVAYCSLPSRAAFATRTFPRTASHIPKYPVKAEKTAPTRKKIDRPILSLVEFAGRINKTKNTKTTKTLKVLNCLFK